jgi:hypothetical protein
MQTAMYAPLGQGQSLMRDWLIGLAVAIGPLLASGSLLIVRRFHVHRALQRPSPAEPSR